MIKRKLIETWSAEELEALARLFMETMEEMKHRAETAKYGEERAYNIEMRKKLSIGLDYVLDIYNLNKRVGRENGQASEEAQETTTRSEASSEGSSERGEGSAI